MFQKLYRHLEEIKISLREDRSGVSDQVGATIVGQLESVNATLVQLQHELAARNSASAQAAINRRPPERQMILRMVSVAVIIPLLLFMAFTLSQINRSMSNQPVQTERATAGMATAAAAMSTADSAALAGNSLAVQKHLATLDSLIMEQQQSLTELRRLNTTAVLTMQRIRRHFMLSDRITKVPPAAPIDSFTVAK